MHANRKINARQVDEKFQNGKLHANSKINARQVDDKILE